jgi:hypothetical protein
MKLTAKTRGLPALRVDGDERGRLGDDGIDGTDGLQVLQDGRVRGTHGNIHHIAIAPAGVFVADARAYEGLTEIRNDDWFWKPDWLGIAVASRLRSGWSAPRPPGRPRPR